ncbi:stage V sporulation protein B [Natranaerovirga hydrolytica]|uniref:Stage V sporulation protein B n=1 Tax=Natranaerovirga hydrolytica TaxID=680378 RepID=A0A4R1N0V8_9FIRM|nr:polysaccharide biosynthesis protein [Natranaerovirga hydrolytica]TCK98560.1 stage V sporulation protein B [Natranaerovirga hydrolytica]
MSQSSKNSIIKGAFILTAVGLVTRVIGFLYRIYMSNLIGAEGMGIFQLIFPVFMICYTLCCSGLFTAISKLVAAQKASNNSTNISKVINMATLISFSLSVLLSVIIYFFSEYISSNILNEPRTLLSLKILAFTVPFTAIGSSVKAYFYGLQKTFIPASSQLMEQIIRVLSVYLLSGFFIPLGLEYACAMAVIGMALGEVITCFYVIIAYRISLKSKLNQWSKKANYIYKYKSSIYHSYKTISKSIAAIAVPLTANRVLITLLSSVETILIPSRLQLYGLNHSASISIYGVLTGMAMPLILFPSVFTSSLSLMLLPAVSEANASKNKNAIRITTSKTLQYTLLIGIISTFIFIVFGEPLGLKIYNDPLVGNFLIILAWLCPFMYLNSTLGSILNGLDYELITFRNNTIGLGIRITFTFFVIPILGLQGYLWGVLVSSLVITLLDLLKIVKVTTIKFDVVQWLLKPLLSAFIASVVVSYLYYQYIFHLSNALIPLLGSCMLLGLIYFVFIMFFNCIPKDDIKNIKHSI